jgi:predicted negative regulator of RcsB-dependent stress response
LAGKKIKVHNKDLQKADEIINLPQRMVGWVQARMQWLAGGALALVVMLVMVWAFTSHGQVKERRAQMQYAQVLDNLSQQGKSALQGQLWQTLIPELQAVSEQFRGTRTALSAQMDLAEAYFQIRQFEQALQLDLKSARELSGNATLQSFVRYRLAMTYQELNKPDEAIAQLESLLSSHLASLQRGIHWQLGQLYRQKQETAKAAEQYQKALEVEGVYPPGALLQDALAGLKLAEQAGSATSVPSVKP